ncbi:MAG: DNA translocase FtsK [Bacteroidales bacterium]|nr:DNA translocase FtsK [Bacteroidales bacterium]
MGKKTKKQKVQDDRFKFLTGIFFLFLAIYITLAFTSFFFTWKTDQSFQWGEVVSNANVVVENWAGKVGARMANLFIAKWFGVASFFIPFFLVILAFKLFKVKLLPVKKTLQYSILGLILLSLLLGYLFEGMDGYLINGLGGGHGLFMAQWMNAFIGKVGTAFLLIIFLTAFILSLYPVSIQQIKQGVISLPGKIFSGSKKMATANVSAVGDIRKSGEIKTGRNKKASAGKKEENTVKEWSTPEEVKNTKQEITPEKESGTSHSRHREQTNKQVEDSKTPDNGEASKDGDIQLTIEKSEEEREEGDLRNQEIQDYDPTLELSDFQLPPIELLEEYGDEEGEQEINKEEIIRNKNKIVETLGNYKIQIDKIRATIGPTVTLYEIVPAPGIRISKIKNLEDDIALSLAALGIRIIAPIPGKGTIGIEVPNEKREMVSMRSILTSKNFREARHELPIGLGKTISNETYVIDLGTLPHLLVAGATGQGKSVGLNAIITSLLYKKHPTQLKFVLVDPKKVEFTPYFKIRNHYMAKIPDIEEPIVTDNQDIIKTLNSLCLEMDDRYNLLKMAHVRNISEYNKKFIKKRLNPEKGHRYLPYIVVVIDEFADLIMTAGKEVESPIARLAQLARAIGIHLIIATQRPTTNIITGVIKANFPARIAFRVTSQIDSRTILDSTGANQLIGRGDMLISTGSDLTRLQCAFIDPEDIEKLTDFISNQQGFAQPFELPEYEDENSLDENGSKKVDKWDDLFEEAARMVVRHQQGSTSLIQRKLSIGYNRAGRIMDQLETANIVGSHEGSKARHVLFPDEYALEQYLNNLFNKNQ